MHTILHYKLGRSNSKSIGSIIKPQKRIVCKLTFSKYRVGHKYCYKIKYKHILKKAFISIFKFANIQDSYQQTISHKLYSKCFPLAFTTAWSLLEKSLMEARTIFMGIFSHVFINFNFRASILGLGLEQASLSRIDHKK